MNDKSYLHLVEFPQAQFQLLDITFNDWNEMVISAVDMNGNQVGRFARLPTPSGSFLLLFNPLTLDWQTMVNLEPIDGYELVKCIKYAE